MSFGIWVKKVRSIGDIDLFQVPSDPNGKFRARIGSIAVPNDGSSVVWKNTDGLDTWSPVGSSSVPLLMFGNASVGSTATTRYLSAGSTGTLAETAPSQLRVTRDGTLSNLSISHNIPDGNGNDIVYTVRKNGIPTSLSVSLASTSPVDVDVANQVSVIAGDSIDIEVSKASGIAKSPRNIVGTLEFA